MVYAQVGLLCIALPQWVDDLFLEVYLLECEAVSRRALVFKAHRLLYHSTLGWRVIKKKVYLMGSWYTLVQTFQWCDRIGETRFRQIWGS